MPFQFFKERLSSFPATQAHQRNSSVTSINSVTSVGGSFSEELAGESSQIRLPLNVQQSVLAPVRPPSRLSAHFHVMMANRVATGYLMRHFLEVAPSAALWLRFCLDAESFRAVTLSRCSSFARHRQIQADNNSDCTTDGSCKSSDTSKPSSALCDNCNSTQPNTDEFDEEKLLQSIQEDALHIYRTYLAPETDTPISFPNDLHSSTLAAICNSDKASPGAVAPNAFEEARSYLLRQIEVDHFHSFCGSKEHAAYQHRLLTNCPCSEESTDSLDPPCLADLLFHEEALFHFTEFIQSEGAGNLLQFVLAAEAAAAPTKGGFQMFQEDALAIYDKYFSMQAPCPIGFGAEVRLEVECAICPTDVETSDKSTEKNFVMVRADCFDKPKQMVMQFIEETYLTKFLRSQIFYNYISELESAKNATTLPSRGCIAASKSGALSRSLTSNVSRGGSGSDEVSVVTKNNTLLAGSTCTVSEARSALCSPSNHLLNDEDLWRRNVRGGAGHKSLPLSLSCGRVDRYGRFHSELLTCSDCTDLSMGGSTVGGATDVGIASTPARFLALFSGRRSKQQEEEAAMQVAMMILDDVNSLTSEGAAAAASISRH